MTEPSDERSGRDIFLWWMLGTDLVRESKPKGSQMLGGFGGGRTLLGPDPESQSLFFAASRHFDRKVRKSAFLSAGIFCLETWLIACVQLSKQSPFMCHLAHIFTFPSQEGLSWGKCLLKVSCHDSPAFVAKILVLG
jgi:hypothetical protein